MRLSVLVVLATPFWGFPINTDNLALHGRRGVAQEKAADYESDSYQKKSVNHRYLTALAFI